MRVVGVEVQFCLAHLIRDVKFLCCFAGCPRQGLRHAPAVRIEAVVRGDSSSRRDERCGLPSRVGSGEGVDIIVGQACAFDGSWTEYGEAFCQARRVVFYVYHDAGNGPDEQRDGASDSVCRVGSSCDARDAWRIWPSLVRADLDSVGDVWRVACRCLRTCVKRSGIGWTVSRVRHCCVSRWYRDESRLAG